MIYIYVYTLKLIATHLACPFGPGHSRERFASSLFHRDRLVPHRLPSPSCFTVKVLLKSSMS